MRLSTGEKLLFSVRNLVRDFVQQVHPTDIAHLHPMHSYEVERIASPPQQVVDAYDPIDL